MRTRYSRSRACDFFVTGASGHIASGVIPELLAHGHQVVGLARSDDAAAKVAALGAEVRRGDLSDVDGLAAAARGAEGVIHLAFDHGLMRSGALRLTEAAQLDGPASSARTRQVLGWEPVRPGWIEDVRAGTTSRDESALATA